jgi:GST-like protein
MDLQYEVKLVDLSKGEQKTDQFLAICPNGRIPAIVDKDKNNFAVFESGAILLYLAEISGGKFLPQDPQKRSEVIQWLMFQMGGVGPMQGQANVFFRYFPEKIQAAIDRYQNETKRLYAVLDTQLEGKDFICNELTIADFYSRPLMDINPRKGCEFSNS